MEKTSKCCDAKINGTINYSLAPNSDTLDVLHCHICGHLIDDKGNTMDKTIRDFLIEEDDRKALEKSTKT